MGYAADNALQVAIRMELLGRLFYESLAAGCGDAEIASLATALARDEHEHARVFERMRDALPATERGPELSEKELVAAARELRYRIMPRAQEVRDVVLSADIVRALDMAIEMETSAVEYYTELAAACDPDARALVRIAEEERTHLDMLRQIRVLRSITMSAPDASPSPPYR
jgi:rubrerythrin